MKESSLTKKTRQSQSVIFVKEIVMLRKIIGSKGSPNASIVNKIVDLRTINEQVVLRKNRLMKTCFFLIKVLLRKRIMCGSLIVVEQTT